MIRLTRRRPAGLAVVLCLAAVASACRPGEASRPGGQSELDPENAAETSYAPAPQVLRAQIAKGPLGRARLLTLYGQAAPGATIHLQSPEGDNLTTTTRGDGRWTLRLPAVTQARMYALSADMDGRSVHAEGALILTPPPGPPALLARAGAGALAIEPANAAPAITAVDYDPNGFAAVSGLAQPEAVVQLLVDGAPAGLSHADAQGRYAVLAAGRRLSFGDHVAVIRTPAGEAKRPFRLVQPGPLSAPYQVASEPDGWRMEWAPPGGGVQTTLVFDGKPAR